MSELNGTNGAPFTYYPRLKRLHQYVEQSYSEPISLGRAAGIAALESSYFSTYFRAKVGITFTDWLRQVRIRKATELIEASDFSITEVAYEVGFADLTTFGRAFKKHTRMTPSEFKKSARPEQPSIVLHAYPPQSFCPSPLGRKEGGGPFSHWGFSVAKPRNKLCSFAPPNTWRLPQH